MTCNFIKYKLQFKIPGGTSRGILHQKDTYIIKLEDNGKIAYGECNRFKNLSFDDREIYEDKLSDVCKKISERRENILDELEEWPSIYFGVETLLKDWENGCQQIIFPEVIQNGGFSIPINALIWMGEKDFMLKQITQKLEEGYTSIKLKIGAIDFQTELALIQYIRKQFNEQEVEIRLDANGAFQANEALDKLNQLADFQISYIEQPIRAGQWQEMADIVEKSPIKIALDEELIGIISQKEKEKMMQTISPQLLILKPALIGGFQGSTTWKNLIEQYLGSWVITSALESNIGLNAIAQYTALGYTDYAQGLGTGQLYTNNFPSPYSVDAKGIHYHTSKKWDLSLLTKI
ncbi:MAG: o-succinylbenzoate synthase [Chitinophagales bacterium]|nr:o-succinylbenzoate synthase [Chitinophagales bacterium]